MVTIDASVLVAAIDQSDPERSESGRFLAAVAASVSRVHQPTLSLVEVMAAISRRSSDADAARQAGSTLLALPGLVLHPLDIDGAADAAAIAVSARLRGADATYVAVALRSGSTLVTLDGGLLERAAALVPVTTPEAWLAGTA